MGMVWHLQPGGRGRLIVKLGWVLCYLFFLSVSDKFVFLEKSSPNPKLVWTSDFSVKTAHSIWVHVGYSPVPKQPEKLKNCSAGSWDWGEVNMFFFKCPSFLFPKWIYRQDLTSISTLVQEKNKWTIVQNIISFGVNDGSTIFPLLQSVAFLSLALTVVTSGCLWPKPKAIPWIPKGHLA